MFPDLDYFFMEDHHKPSCPLKILHGCFRGQGHSKNVQNFNYCLLDDDNFTAEPFVTKLFMVIHHLKPECHKKRKRKKKKKRGQDQCHTDGFYNQNVTTCSKYSHSFASRFSLMADHHKLKCTIEILRNFNIKYHRNNWVTILRVKFTALT